MAQMNTVEKIILSRKNLIHPDYARFSKGDNAAEGGCGVIGIACNEQIAGAHLLQALSQMRNRGNGKGGGIAAIGLDPQQFGVSQETLEEDYLLVISYLDPEARQEVEKTSINPIFDIDHIQETNHIADYRELSGLEIKPPEVVQYFIRVKEQFYREFTKEHGVETALRRKVEDEIVYQNTFRLNSTYYASEGDTRAFVLSHGKNMLVLKMVGYGDDVIRYYQLEDLLAHVWIGHHRYPTKGKVWHPGGAHPFVGLNEALVHNGDFANYSSITEYLAQRNIFPLFLTDTEVSVLVYDLLHRIYDYPLEYVIEALAPTTERDFSLLPPEKQRIYQLLQSTHIHSSPDGPWFFLIGQSVPNGKSSSAYQLIGITDTSMLRPQVFALQESGNGGPSIGFAASEKQAIDAALESLSTTDHRFWSKADIYWNARGGSHTDGGAFIFSVNPKSDGKAEFECTDKFGTKVTCNDKNPPYTGKPSLNPPQCSIPDIPTNELFNWFTKELPDWDYEDLIKHLHALTDFQESEQIAQAIDTITLLIDRRYPTGRMRRSSLLSLYENAFSQVLTFLKEHRIKPYIYLDAHNSNPKIIENEEIVIIESRGFPPDGENSLARVIVNLYQKGGRRFILANTRGHRFIANGIGTNTIGTHIDVYGSPGDYLASGLDGAEVIVHGNGQDQLAQIMKSGKLIVHGDVGQTFGYAAKGGSIFILGNAAGRPMINGVGKPKVIINGTCLDYLAESFMAGDPLNGGGFIIVNGIKVTHDGKILELETPYPGGNLFSLASGGAIYLRDPHRLVSEDQLNGGEFTSLSEQDWNLIIPYLEENARLFNIPISELLQGKAPDEVYRKIHPKKVQALQAEEIWVREKNNFKPG